MHPIAHRIRDRAIGCGHRLQPVRQPFPECGGLHVSIARQTEADDALDHGEQVLDAVMQFLRQDGLMLLGLFFSIDVRDQEIKGPVDVIDQHDADGGVERVRSDRDPMQCRNEQRPLRSSGQNCREKPWPAPADQRRDNHGRIDSQERRAFVLAPHRPLQQRRKSDRDNSHRVTEERVPPQFFGGPQDVDGDRGAEFVERRFG